MSRRFGRNQKRRLVQELDSTRVTMQSLQAALNLEQQLSTHTRETMRQQHESLALVEQMLGKYFAGL